MRLLRFRLPDFREQGGLLIEFGPLAQDDPRVAFLIGPNGAGKSRVLEAIGQIFAHLSAGVAPGFRFEIEYLLGESRILLSSERSCVEALGSPPPLPQIGGWLLVAPSDCAGWEAEHVQRAWPSYLDRVLPYRVVGISSGPASRLDWALRESVASTLSQRLPEAPSELSASERSEELEAEEEMIRAELRGLQSEPRCVSIEGHELVLAILVQLAHPLAQEGGGEERAAVLAKAGLGPGSLVAFNFTVAGDWRARLPPEQHTLFAAFRDQASRQTLIVEGGGGASEAEGEDRRTIYVPTRTLGEWIAKNAKTPFVWFSQLQSWLKSGALGSPQLLLKIPGREGLIRDRDLSDGEFLILGRYSLLILLAEHRGCLVLFDEPETHFNDRWKVDLVYDIERILAGAGAQVLIATHSDLTLSDAERREVFIIERDGGAEGEEVPHAPTISPLGADRGEITQQVFGASAASGRRATEIVDAAIASGDRERLEQTLRRVGPGFQEFRLRYAIERDDSAS